MKVGLCVPPPTIAPMGALEPLSPDAVAAALVAVLVPLTVVEVPFNSFSNALQAWW
jgi:hypothetical protein